MQDVDAGIPLDTHMCYKENKAYKLCFTGENTLDNKLLYSLFILIGWKTLSSRVETYFCRNSSH